MMLSVVMRMKWLEGMRMSEIEMGQNTLQGCKEFVLSTL